MLRNVRWYVPLFLGLLLFESSVGDPSHAEQLQECGNGVVEGSEVCDDGVLNDTTASCCSARCMPQAAASPCADDGSLCTTDICDGAGTCSHPATPASDCKMASGHAALTLVKRGLGGRDRVKFEWSSAFDPPGPTLQSPSDGPYELCVFDETASGPALAFHDRTVAGCSSSPCWTELPTGWRFKADRGAGGITSILWQGRRRGSGARIEVSSMAASLEPRLLPLTAASDVIAQLTTGDACWGATFSNPSKNDTRGFRATSAATPGSPPPRRDDRPSSARSHDTPPDTSQPQPVRSAPAYFASSEPDQTSSRAVRVLAQPTSCPVDVVFVMDTSGSMGDEASALCAKIARVQSDLVGSGITATTHLLGITETPGGSFGCLTGNVRTLLGQTVPGTSTCGSSLTQFESWGQATAIVASRFQWAPGAIRLIVVLSDEGPCEGDPCEDPGADRTSVTNAIAQAAAAKVIASVITGTDSKTCTMKLGSDLAAGTGGMALPSTAPDLDLAASIETIVQGACRQDITAIAGPDQTVPEGTTVTLDGSASHLSNAPPATGGGTGTDGLGGQLFSTGAPLEVEVLPAEAGITSQLWLFSPEPATRIATNRQAGEVFQLGSFPTGSELVFGIAYDNVQLKMGPASRNPDNIVHDIVTPVGAGVYDVGFEDLVGGGDRDYNDNRFEFRGGVSAMPPLTFHWDIVSAQGPPIQLSSATDPKPTFTAFDNGIYTFRLSVTDGTNSASDEVTVTVANEPPVITRVDADPAATDGLAEVTVTFIDAGALDTHVVTFDWGDGTPAQQFPAIVDGTGWGYAYAGHVYATLGDKTVTATVMDKDGGASAPKSKTFNVGAAGRGEAVPSPALWAASTTSPDTIRITGSRNAARGLVHSNHEIRIGGSGHHLTGGTEYRTTINVTGSGSVVSPPAVRTPSVPFPFLLAAEDYQPGGRAAHAAGDRFHAVDASDCNGGKWKPKAPLTSGLYAVPCAVQLSGSDLAGQVTIFATGDIQISGSGASFAPFIDDLLFFSTSTGTRAVDLAGTRHSFHGLIFAGSGGVEITGSGQTFDCGIMGQTARVSGSENTITGGGCSNVTTGKEPVPIAASPVVVPNLEIDLTADKTDVSPGDTIVYGATLRNGSPSGDPRMPGGGASIFMPAELGVDNRGGAPLTVMGVTYSLEYHDVASNAWTPLASTDPSAPAAQHIVTLAARPNPTNGVTYPTSDDLIVGTKVSGGTIGSWAAVAVVALTPDQVDLLLDPSRVDGLRNVVAFTTTGFLVRTIARFAADPLADLRAPSQSRSAVDDVRIHLTRPGAPPQIFDSASTPSLAHLAPGQAASVGASSAVPLAVSKTSGESDTAYLTRLRQVDGAKLIAAAYADATAGVGMVFAAQQVVLSTERLPILDVDVVAPSQVNAGDDAAWTITLTNVGSATATGIQMSVTLVGGLQLVPANVPTSLAPGATAIVTARRSTTPGTTTTLAATTAVTWMQAGGAPALYGPVGGSASVTAKPSVALAVTKTASTRDTFQDMEIEYDLVAHNTGTTQLTHVTLDDPIDQNARIVDGTLVASVGTIEAGTQASDRRVTIDIGTLAADAAASVSFRVSYKGAAPGTAEIMNQATVSSSELPPTKSDDPTLSGAADPTVTEIGVGGGGTGGGGGSGTPGPAISGLSPSDGSITTESVVIDATVTPRPGTTVQSWLVFAAPASDRSATRVLASGFGPPPSPSPQGIARDAAAFPQAASNGVTVGLATFDPTTVPNGIWILSVEAFGSDGGSTVAETSVVVEGRAKYGRFAITYQDLDVPVGGLPVRVRRTYDTLQRFEGGDFGHGWKLDVSTFRVDVNRPLGDGGWEQFICGGGLIFLPVCYQTNLPHYITITWPDDHSETFDFTPTGGVTFFPAIVTPAYTARPGVTSELLPATSDDLAFADDGNLYDGFLGVVVGGVYDPTQFVLRAKNGTEYLLDRAAGLLSARDRFGNTITFSSDGVRSSDGTAIHFERDPNGRIDAIEDPAGRRVAYHRDGAGDLVTTTGASGETTTFTYDQHLLVDIVDPRPGFFRRLDYGDDGRLQSVTDSTGNTVTVAVDPGTRTEAITSNGGRLTTLTLFDARGNAMSVSRIHDGLNRTTRYEYGDDDQLTARTDPLGHRWFATYDAARNPTSLSEPNGDVVHMTYDTTNALKTWTDGEGRTTTYDYDKTGALTSITSFDGTLTTYHYDDHGRLASRDGPTGSRTWTYDGAGRVQTEKGVGVDIAWAYDEAGNVLSRTDLLGSVTRKYDGQGNVLSRTDDDGTTTWKYDVAGRAETVTDSDGTARLEYDPVGNLRQFTSPSGEITTWTYVGTAIETETDPTGVTTWQYDGAGREVGRTEPERTRQWTWDDRGRVTSMSRGDGSIVNFTWDGNARIAIAGDSLAGETTFTWNNAGQLAGVDGPGSDRRSYVRDADGRLMGCSGPGVAANPALRPAPTNQSTIASTDTLVLPAWETVEEFFESQFAPWAPPPPLEPLETSPSQDTILGGTGGELGEYLTTLQIAFQARGSIVGFGLATKLAFARVAVALSQDVAIQQAPPLIGDPGEITDQGIKDGPEPGIQPRPTKQRRPPCPNDPLGSQRLYGPTRDYLATGLLAATYACAQLRPFVTPGGRAGRRINPPGYARHTSAVDRGHLIANVLGGSPTEPGNFVSLFHKPNRGLMRVDEGKVRNEVNFECHGVTLDVTPRYRIPDEDTETLWGRGQLPVEFIRYLAVNDAGAAIVNDVIPNTP